MNEFILKEIVNADMACELDKIGFDKSYIHKAVDKFHYHNIKIYNLTPAQANILKQTALITGADCATHREVITAQVKQSDCILGASASQILQIAAKLEHQPFGLKKLGAELAKMFGVPNHTKTQIVGILNVTENSFSDGGMYYDTENACGHLLELVNDGADIIDIGAESTKPFSTEINAEHQLEKLVPVLDFVKKQNIKIPISIDTRSATVAEKCIGCGVQIINDVSGLEYDTKMADVISKSGVKIIIQHSQGTPENMQISPHYKSIMDDIYIDLKRRVDFALSKGIKKENIIIDPGIGFGKTREDNFDIIRRIEEFYGLGLPVMLGLSRKSLLNMQDEDNFTKDIYTAALNTLVISKKVDYIRVHNVKLHKKLSEFNI